MNQSGCSFGQFMVSQTPKYDNNLRRRKSHGNQVISKKSGLIRPDKRKRTKYL